MGRVQLHCPSTCKTVDGFVIGSYQKPEQVLQGVRLALDIKFAALYTTEAKHISDPQTLQEDDRVLVAASEAETMLPDAPYGYAMYEGEEGEDVDPDVEGFGMEWQDLTDHEKCIHILSLADKKPTTRNKLRITRNYKAVRDDMVKLEQQQELSDAPTSTAHHEALVQERWNVPLDLFLKQTAKHPASSSAAAAKFHTSPSSLSSTTVATLAIFSSLTHGQARLAGEVLCEAVALRTKEDQGEAKDPVLRENDVRNAVEIVYERAGVVPVKLTKGKGGKARDRKRAKGKGKKVDGKLGM